MNERLRSYDRESVKQNFKKRFGDMLEEDELLKLIGRDQDLEQLVEEKRIFRLWPGENKPLYPYLQLNKGRIRPEIKEVFDAIDLSSDGKFFSPVMFCEWMCMKIDGEKRMTPLLLLRLGKKNRLIKEAEKFGTSLLPKSFS